MWFLPLFWIDGARRVRVEDSATVQATDDARAELVSVTRIIEVADSATIQATDDARAELVSVTRIIEVADSATIQATDDARAELVSVTRIIEVADSATVQATDDARAELVSATWIIEVADSATVQATGDAHAEVIRLRKTPKHVDGPRRVGRFALIFTGTAFKAGGVTLLARIYGQDNTPITRATLQSIDYAVRDLTSGETLDSGEIVIDGGVFDGFQTDLKWTRDAVGYNFVWTVPATTPIEGGHRIQVDVRFVPVEGEPFIQAWQFTPHATFV